MTFVICSFVICSFILRLVPLGRYVTPDEPAWVYRSILFADAVTARDWAAIPETGHPGVTTMWLGAVGVAVRRLFAPAESAAHLDWIRNLAWLAPENGAAFRHLAFFLPGGRIAVALTTTLGLIILYPLLRRLLDRRTALLTVGLLAFDPFLIGHSGLLHTDALLATFTLLALAFALLGLQEPRRLLWYAPAGLFAGLALLTKTPAIVILPFILGLIALNALRFTFHVSRFTLASLLFLSATALTVFALYPSLWIDPLAAIRPALSFTGRHVASVQRPISFAGEMTYDPGPAFYPAVLLFRASPIALIGIVIGLIKLRRFPPDRRYAFLTLIAFALLFGAGMSLGAKKHDRYLLPALPPLTVAAALGFGTLADGYIGKLVKHIAPPNLPTYQPTNLPTYQ